MELQGNYEGNKLLTSSERREKEHASGALPSSVAHSLVPSQKASSSFLNKKTVYVGLKKLNEKQISN